MGCKNCKKQNKKDINVELITLDGEDTFKIQVKEANFRNLKHTNKVTNMVSYATEYHLIVRNHNKLAEFMDDNEFQFIINGHKLGQDVQAYELNGNKLKIKIEY